ncbi:hypothetical protein ADUPG1_006603 [Aduncisulcus paluster]|uniref:Uncharacterized protein n=1 Tax=Aduncisulcus paluster TaxID=2918883 RepID=A0ABQ5KLR8_9EUKA|nr:hypothetical protein ADUPG1_006603 [Aduncisulcus paluster]
MGTPKDINVYEDIYVNMTPDCTLNVSIVKSFLFQILKAEKDLGHEILIPLYSICWKYFTSIQSYLFSKLDYGPFLLLQPSLIRILDEGTHKLLCDDLVSTILCTLCSLLEREACREELVPKVYAFIPTWVERYNKEKFCFLFGMVINGIIRGFPDGPRFKFKEKQFAKDIIRIITDSYTSKELVLSSHFLLSDVPYYISNMTGCNAECSMLIEYCANMYDILIHIETEITPEIDATIIEKYIKGRYHRCYTTIASTVMLMTCNSAFIESGEIGKEISDIFDAKMWNLVRHFGTRYAASRYYANMNKSYELAPLCNSLFCKRMHRDRLEIFGENQHTLVEYLTMERTSEEMERDKYSYLMCFSAVMCTESSWGWLSEVFLKDWEQYGNFISRILSSLLTNLDIFQDQGIVMIFWFCYNVIIHVKNLEDVLIPLFRRILGVARSVLRRFSSSSKKGGVSKGLVHGIMNCLKILSDYSRLRGDILDIILDYFDFIVQFGSNIMIFVNILSRIISNQRDQHYCRRIFPYFIRLDQIILKMISKGDGNIRIMDHLDLPNYSNVVCRLCSVDPSFGCQIFHLVESRLDKWFEMSKAEGLHIEYDYFQDVSMMLMAFSAIPQLIPFLRACFKNICECFDFFENERGDPKNLFLFISRVYSDTAVTSCISLLETINECSGSHELYSCFVENRGRIVSFFEEVESAFHATSDGIDEVTKLCTFLNGKAIKFLIRNTKMKYFPDDELREIVELFGPYFITITKVLGKSGNILCNDILTEALTFSLDFSLFEGLFVMNSNDDNMSFFEYSWKMAGCDYVLDESSLYAIIQNTMNLYYGMPDSHQPMLLKSIEKYVKDWIERYPFISSLFILINLVISKGRDPETGSFAFSLDQLVDSVCKASRFLSKSRDFSMVLQIFIGIMRSSSIDEHIVSEIYQCFLQMIKQYPKYDLNADEKFELICMIQKNRYSPSSLIRDMCSQFYSRALKYSNNSSSITVDVDSFLVQSRCYSLSDSYFHRIISSSSISLIPSFYIDIANDRICLKSPLFVSGWAGDAKQNIIIECLSGRVLDGSVQNPQKYGSQKWETVLKKKLTSKSMIQETLVCLHYLDEKLIRKKTYRFIETTSCAVEMLFK